jgi:hypothetical protein
MDIPYIPGSGEPPELPLGRFIPPVPVGMVRSWCDKYLLPGDWVLEPFGFNPMVPIEIASAGYRVLTTINNPIHAFMLRVIASAPQKEAFIAALQDLATAPKGDDRMEPYIRSLYSVTCASCKQKIEAESFLWERGSEYPFAAQVDCPYCGTVGEQEISETDKEYINALPPIQLHQARALNRIVGQDSTLRSSVMSALNAYPSRPMIILQTIINKLDSLEQNPRRRELLTALILSAADQGNTLWAHPSPRSRPRQIVVPNIYQERNLWKAMEEAIEKWQLINTPIPILEWGDAPLDAHGIHLFIGRFRELNPRPDENFFSAVMATIPRPNQAFWTLSALWTGWIWGHEAVGPIKNVLARQRYDWNWHTNALSSVFDAVNSYHHSGLKLWGLVAENEPMLLLATLLGAETAGISLSAFAHSIDDQIAQCYWDKHSGTAGTIRPSQAMAAAREIVKEYLQQKGEPASYQQIHTAEITGLAKDNKLAIDIFLQNPNSAASETQKSIESLFNEEDLLQRVGGGKASIETGEWWLRHPENSNLPLIDRIERKLLSLLIEKSEISTKEIKAAVYETFQGLFTPEDKMILNCLESYADLVDQENHLWKLKDNEQRHLREAEVGQIREIIKRLGKKLKYKTSEEDPILWLDETQAKPVYSFHVISTAIISDYVKDNNHRPAQRKILVFPGSRANLIAYKKQRNPVLADLLDRNFISVKFRLIRDLDANPLLSRELFHEQIQVDPPEYRASQLALF